MIVAAPGGTRTLDEDGARRVLSRALTIAGLVGDGVELVRLGSNVVFRLSDRSVIARVARRWDAEESVGREVRVARWLAAQGVPAARALAVEQPIVVEGWAVGLWESVNDQDDFGTVLDLADLLRALHALPLPPFDLPAVDPVGRLLSRIEAEPALSLDDRAFLQSRAAAVGDRYRTLTFALLPGVLHGDANVGNVLRDRNGVARLVDLDDFSVGPREWDLIQTAIFYERFGWHSAEEYEAFVQGYGFDVMTWPGYAVLREIRELSMVAWLAGIEGNGGKRTEFDKRMASLRSGNGFDQWRPF
jgi:aminoglycoside phosphotransferase (APT) family kinase protein